MNWPLMLKVALAIVAIAGVLNAIVFAVRTSRDAIHEWKAPRAIADK